MEINIWENGSKITHFANISCYLFANHKEKNVTLHCNKHGKENMNEITSNFGIRQWNKQQKNYISLKIKV